MGIQLDAQVKAEGETERIDLPDELEIKALKRNEKLVYSALRQSKGPLKAYELLDKLHDRGLRAPMTIYRALDALIDKDCVRKIESLNAFVAVSFENASHARAFLICRECMLAKEMTLDERQVENLFSPAQVSAGDVRIEAFGDCHQACNDIDKASIRK